MDKVIELSFRSIIRYLNGENELSKEYKKKALDLQFDRKGFCKIEEHIPQRIRKQLYEMVS